MGFSISNWLEVLLSVIAPAGIQRRNLAGVLINICLLAHRTKHHISSTYCLFVKIFANHCHVLDAQICRDHGYRLLSGCMAMRLAYDSGKAVS